MALVLLRTPLFFLEIQTSIDYKGPFTCRRCDASEAGGVDIEIRSSEIRMIQYTFSESTRNSNSFVSVIFTRLTIFKSRPMDAGPFDPFQTHVADLSGVGDSREQYGLEHP